MIERMQKIRLIAPKENLNQLLEKIAQLECVDFHQIEQKPIENSKELTDINSQIIDAENLLSFVNENPGSLSKNNPEDFFVLGKNILIKLQDLQKQKQELVKKIEELKPFKLLDFDKSKSDQLLWTKVLLLEGSEQYHYNLQDFFKDNLKFQFVGQKDKNKKIFLYIFPKELFDKVLQKASQLNLQALPLPIYSPKKQIKELFTQLKLIKKNIVDYQNQLKEIAPDKKTWLRFIFELRWRQKLLQLYLKAPQTAKFVVFEGWVLLRRFDELVKSLKEISKFIIVEKLPFDPEEAPVALKNNKIVRVFEMVTKLYGLPKPSEFDPTAFLAPFFTIFFGFALSDAGYGLALMLIGLIILFYLKKYEILKDVGLLCLLLGASTVIFGYILGTFWGINLSKVIDPQIQPMKVLMICFALGILQIISGLIISFLHQIKQGARLVDVFNEKGFWILALFSFLILLAQDIFNLNFIAPNTLLKISGILLFINLLTTTIFSPKIFSGFVKGLGGLYGGVNFLADTLSYSRLFALGLATGVVAYTINLVAGILKEMITVPVLSEIIFFGVLILGHLFNIAINVLGAFIHSSRLQFVEFFSKFLEGGGRQFNPLKFNQ